MRLIAIAVFAAAALSLASLPSAYASDAKGNYALRGVGSQDCGTLVQQLQKDPGGAINVASWILGYMTAVNRYEPTTFDIAPVTDARALTNIAISLCQKNPKARLESVLADMMRAMARTRVQSESPLVEMKSGNVSVNVRQEVLLAVQQRLNQRGLLKAKADGSYGPQTEAVLKEFQKIEKLPVTGVVDSATVLRLLVDQPSAGSAAPAPAPARPAQPAPAQPRR